MEKLKKIIIEIAGGLGNQMFQYAFYVKMKQLGYDAFLYLDPSQHIHNGFELTHVFKLDASFAGASDIEDLRKKDQAIIARLLRKMTGTTTSFYWEHNKGYGFKEHIFTQHKSIYLQGCWLSELYFEDVKDRVQQSFEFPAFTNPGNIALAERIAADAVPVSIHLRRGDYLKSSVHLNIDYLKYLSAALEKLKNITTATGFYVFSDDMAYAQSVLGSLSTGEVPLHFIDWNNGAASFNDMHLMSLCKHNIITNSTFSWWAAWLNKYPQKTIISPLHWFSKNEWNNNSIVPDSWIRI